MLTGIMPLETFPEKTECRGSETIRYVEQDDEKFKYKIFPCVFLTDMNGSKPSSSRNEFEPAREFTQSINAGIFINAPACKVTVGSVLNVKNWIYAKYSGRKPLYFYGPPTEYGERFKLLIRNNELDTRIFAKEADLDNNTGSRDKTAFYQQI